MICSTTEEGAKRKAESYGFKRSTSDWRVLVNDPAVEAVVIASPQHTHKDIALAAFKLGKPVLCEKPMGASTADAKIMVDAAAAAGVPNMVGFNYIRTPASQYARELIASGAIGKVTWFRGEHTEDFFADPTEPANWRSQGRANGTMGDLSSHMINCAMAPVTNDDHAHCLCRFTSGVMGHLYFSRIAAGRKMGYAYEVGGTEGSIRFDQEDQNTLWLYKMSDEVAQRGYRKILTGPAHPDYEPFCLGPGHGTGYQDQLIIEAKDFLQSVASGEALWPTFKDGLAVNHVIDAMWASSDTRSWVDVTQV